MPDQKTSRAALNRAASDATRERLVDGAAAALNEITQSELRVAHVVARAGCSRGAFYLHFEDREAVLRALAERFLDGLNDELRHVPTAASASAQIEAVMDVYVGYVLGNEPVARATFELGDRDLAVAAKSLALIRAWSAQTVRAMRRLDTFDASDEVLHRRSFMIVCMMEGVLKRITGSDPVEMPGLHDRAILVRDFSTIWHETLRAS